MRRLCNTLNATASLGFALALIVAGPASAHGSNNHPDQNRHGHSHGGPTGGSTGGTGGACGSTDTGTGTTTGRQPRGHHSHSGGGGVDGHVNSLSHANGHNRTNNLQNVSLTDTSGTSGSGTGTSDTCGTGDGSGDTGSGSSGDQGSGNGSCSLDNPSACNQGSNGSGDTGCIEACDPPANPTPVVSAPEPGTLTLFGVGISALIIRRRRKTSAER